MELRIDNEYRGIAKGYKQTEVGVIPEDWEIHTIEKLCNVMGRVGWKGYTKKDLVEYGPYTIGAKHIDKNNRLDLSDPTCLSLEKYLESPEIFVFKDDLLIVQRGTIGKLVLIDSEIGKATINPSMLIIRSKTNISGYIYYYLLSEEGQSQILNDTSSTGVPMITQKQVKFFKLPLPPTLTEQRAIATVLSDTDALLRALEQKIAKKKLIKKGVMQELLTPKEGWEEKKLGEFVRFQVGYPFSSIYFNKENQGIRLIKNRDLKSDDAKIFYKGEYTTDFIVKNGDVLIGMDGDFIPCFWSKGIGLLNQRIGRLQAVKQVSTQFLFYYLQKPLKEVENKTSSTTVKHLSHSDVEELQLFLPSVEEQIHIAQILSDIDKEIETLEQKLAKYQLAKQGIMQQLLTGKIRLV